MELRLASTYTESKAHLLNDVLEEFFFDDGSFWEAAPLPCGPRDVTFELINTMVRPKRHQLSQCTLQRSLSASKPSRGSIMMVVSYLLSSLESHATQIP